MDVGQIAKLKKISQQLRKSVVRELFEAGSGHSAGCLGFADVMAVLYFHAMRLDSENPNWEDRDIFVMSNGHYTPLLYATLAERGFSIKSWLICENLAPSFKVIQNAAVWRELKRLAVLWAAV